MSLTRKMWRVLLLSTSSLICYNMVVTTSFQVIFQSSSDWSANEFVEFKGSIPTLTTFTSCHWEKLSYFAKRSNTIWSYCYLASNENRNMNCIQLYSMGDTSSYYRKMVYALWIDGAGHKGLDIQVNVGLFRHRAWNHVCVIYSNLDNSCSIYFNGKLSGRTLFDALPIFPGSKSVKEHAFILGQEPDSMRGSFSAGQAFYGSISEFNFWNESIKEKIIMKMAAGTHFEKGNVISWKKENFIFKGLVPKNIQDEISFFRNEQKRHVIFPKKLFKHEAADICNSHGGFIVTPGSDFETEEVRNILLSHSQTCSNENGATECWLGLEKPESYWIVIGNQSKILDNTYSKWKDDNWKSNFEGMCSRLQIDGAWKADTKESCDSVRLCAVCEFSKTPVFSIKGLCDNDNHFQWNYYPVINNSYQIDAYEGFKRHLTISLHNNQWKSTSNGDWFKISNVEKPVGRMEWEWFEKSCTRDVGKRNLTFSHCDLDKELTCDSGNCVSIRKRCNSILDCKDGSDEDECGSVIFPAGYDRLNPPKSNSNGLFPVNTNIIIKNINQIDMERMMLDSSLKLTMEWRDSRLMFRNLPQIGHQKPIRSKISSKLWLPIQSLVYENAIIGEIEADPKVHISLETRSHPIPTDINQHREEFVYSGSNTTIQLSKMVRIKTTCNFQFTKFPFDQHECKIILHMRDLSNNEVDLVGTNQSISYTGGNIVSQFDVARSPYLDSFQHTQNKSSHNGLTVVVVLKRRPINGIIQIITPSVVLWLLAFLTLQYDVDDLTNRNRTSVTALLVLVTLFGSLTNKSDFPKTSGFKAIDVWFVWYLINIFIIICHHTAISKITRTIKNNAIAMEEQHSYSMYEKDEDMLAVVKSLKRRETINNVMILILLLSTLSFNVCYFFISYRF